MLLPLLLAMQMASSDTISVYNGRQNQLSVQIPRFEAEMTIDGVLDELAWSKAGLLTGFSQFSPSDGVPAADSTEVLVWYSPSAIYFGIRAYEQHGQVHATLADRDRIFADDNIQILLSTFNDGRQATVFMVNPLGVQADGSLVETGQAGTTSIMGGGGALPGPDQSQSRFCLSVEGTNHRVRVRGGGTNSVQRTFAISPPISRPGASTSYGRSSTRGTRIPGARPAKQRFVPRPVWKARGPHRDSPGPGARPPARADRARRWDADRKRERVEL